MLFKLLTDHSLSDEAATNLYMYCTFYISSWAKSTGMFHRVIRRSAKDPVMFDITKCKLKFSEKNMSLWGKDLEGNHTIYHVSWSTIYTVQH